MDAAPAARSVRVELVLTRVDPGPGDRSLACVQEALDRVGAAAVAMRSGDRIVAEGWSVSVSHADALVLVALAAGEHALGVDVEVVRPRRSLPALARRVMTDTEHEQWLARGGTERGFYEHWTAYEAYVKATGAGIARAGLRARPPADWLVEPLPLPGDVCGAVVLGPSSPGRVAAELRWHDPPEPGEPQADAGPIRRVATSSAGVALAAAMRGLGDVLEPTKREQPAIVEEFRGEEPFGDRILMRLDPDNPADSIVWIRSASEEPERDEPRP